MKRRARKTLKSDFNDTWTCHICGEERPDDKISVLTKPLVIRGRYCGAQNIRYCNDRRACIEGAKEFGFFKDRKGAASQKLEGNRVK